MKRARREQENPPQAKFCLECATPAGGPGSPRSLTSPDADTPNDIPRSLSEGDLLELGRSLCVRSEHANR